MSSRYYQAAAAGAALVAAVTLAACGTGASPGTPASSTPAASAPAAATPAAFNTADITFTTGTLGLEEQAAALAGTVTGHTATPELQQFAAGMRAQAGDAQHLRDLMGDWRQPMPAPYSPGASLPAGMMGTGMMNAADWAEINHESRAVVQQPLAGRHDQQLQRRGRPVPARAWLRRQPAGPRAGPHHAGATAIRTRSAAAMAAGRASDGHDGLITTAARRRWQKRKSGGNPRLGMATA